MAISAKEFDSINKGLHELDLIFEKKNIDVIKSIINRDYTFKNNWSLVVEDIGQDFNHNSLENKVKHTLNIELITSINIIQGAWVQSNLKGQLAKWKRENPENKKSLFSSVLEIAIPLLPSGLIAGLAAGIATHIVKNITGEIVKEAIKTATENVIEGVVKGSYQAIKGHLGERNIDKYFVEEFQLLKLKKKLEDGAIQSNIKLFDKFNFISNSTFLSKNIKAFYHYCLLKSMVPFKEKTLKCRRKKMLNLFTDYKSIVMKIGFKGKLDKGSYPRENIYYYTSYVLGVRVKKRRKILCLFKMRISLSYYSTKNMLLNIEDIIVNIDTAFNNPEIFIVLRNQLQSRRKENLERNRKQWFHASERASWINNNIMQFRLIAIDRISEDIEEFAISKHKEYYPILDPYKEYYENEINGQTLIYTLPRLVEKKC